jgi:hypothetical protein
MSTSDDIGAYYQRKNEASRVAWAKVQDAIDRGADVMEINRLRERAIDAGDCGD